MRALRRWWWIPALAFLAIFLKALLLTPWVAGKAEDAAVAALAAENLGAVDFVEVNGVDGLGGDGLNVIVEGPVGDEQAAVAALEAREEINQVTYRPVEGPAAAEAVESTTTSAAPTTTVAEVALDPMRVELTAAAAGGIVLSGTVPDERDREALVAEAGAEYGPANITDELVVDPETTSESGELVLRGEAPSTDVRDEWLGRGQAVASAGGLTVIDELTVRSVDAQLNDLFALEPIEFDVGRSTIRPSSSETLDAAATLLNDNPDVGPLRVVGHTDGDGSDQSNQALSEARAAAVVNYLVTNGDVDAERLEAEGRGERELLVEPEVTDEDKQRNRRIEWELIQ